MPTRRPSGRSSQPSNVDRQVVLTDLIVLGHVGIEVVLAVEDRGPDLTVKGSADPHGVLDRGPIQDGQGTGQAETNRADIDVGFLAEAVAAPAEQFGLGAKLGMDLETDDGFPAGRGGGHQDSALSRIGGGRRGAAPSSSAAATWNIRVSPSAGART